MKGVALKAPPSDLSKRLREIADAVGRGEVTDAVCAYVERGGYSFIYGASLHDCAVLASMLGWNCLNRMRA